MQKTNIRHESHIEAHPSIKDELQRKAFEQLERLALQLDRGEISAAQFDTGVMSVWHCVSGLVDKNLIDTISEIKDHKGSGYDFLDSRAFVRGNDTVFVYRKRGGGTVVVKAEATELADQVLDHRDEISPSLAAKNKQDQLTQGLINRGWKRRT
jgi:hypothetical protein